MTNGNDRRVALIASGGFFVGPALARLLADRGHDLVVGDPEDGLGTLDEFAAFCAVFLDGTSQFTTGQFVPYAGGWA